MSLTPEQSAQWPKSRKIADAYEVSYAVVYWNPDGLSAVPAASDEQADAMAVEYQQRGHRAWFVELEGDGELVLWD